jgi:hypothetical protein
LIFFCSSGDVIFDLISPHTGMIFYIGRILASK